MDIVQKRGGLSGAAKLFMKIKYRWERGRAVLWRRCNLARLSFTLSNLGFAQVTYPGDQWFPSKTRKTLG